MATARLHYVLAAIAVVIAICAPVLVWRINDVLRFADIDGPVEPLGWHDANLHFRVAPNEARVLEISRLSSLTFDNGNATWSFFGG